MRSVITIILLFFGVQVMAQQGLQMDFREVDSAEVLQKRQIEYYQLIHAFPSDDLLQHFQLPEFNLDNVYRSRYTLSLATFPQVNYSSVTLHGSDILSPFFYNAEMLSSEAYQLGDKFVLGGYSYGANSVFSAPPPNQNSSYFDTYGSTMFLQYKVSKKFKIETSISIQQSRPGAVGF